MQLFVGQLFQLVHHTENTILIDESPGQTSTLVEDEVDVDVVQDILLELGIQLLLHSLLLGDGLLLCHDSGLLVPEGDHVFRRRRSRQIMGGRCGIRALEIFSHPEVLDRLAHAEVAAGAVGLSGAPLSDIDLGSLLCHQRVHLNRNVLDCKKTTYL